MLNVDAMAVAATAAQEDGKARNVEQLKLRSPVAWANLFDSYHAKIFRYAWSKLRSVPEADDVAAVVFMRALAGIDSYHYRGTPIVAWLYKIASNVIKERQRKVWREHRNTPLDESGGSEDMPDVAAPGEDPDSLISRLDLLDAVASLTREQQTVITLIYVSGFSVKEVAQILGKGERAVYYMQARGLMKLKQELA
jgi:RNA polymerase sigma-70 factor (ECF subfamily)